MRDLNICSRSIKEDRGLLLNEDKFILGTRKQLGHIFDGEKLTIEGHVKAVSEMPTPRNVSDMICSIKLQSSFLIFHQN